VTYIASGELRRLRLPLTLSIAVLLLVAGCGSTGTSGLTTPAPTAASQLNSPAASATPPSPSASPTDPGQWQTVTDATYGYAFRYPATWFDVTVASGAPAGWHDVTDQAGIHTSRDLGATAKWFAVGASPPDPAVGCSETLYQGQKSQIQLDGQSATQIVRQGWSVHPNAWIVDVIAVHEGRCYLLQLQYGPDDQQGSEATMQTFTEAFSY
jgi:hypothetical protein